MIKEIYYYMNYLIWIFFVLERFKEVLQQLDEEMLSQTYRILSLAVSDVDECTNRASCKLERVPEIRNLLKPLNISWVSK